VGTSGDGGGFKKFGRGEIDISDASRPISVEENEAPPGGRHRNTSSWSRSCLDALTVVVSPQTPGVYTITVAELAKDLGVRMRAARS
jgi:phosphate transport system substrate-binding protein